MSQDDQARAEAAEVGTLRWRLGEMVYDLQARADRALWSPTKDRLTADASTLREALTALTQERATLYALSEAMWEAAKGNSVTGVHAEAVPVQFLRLQLAELDTLTQERAALTQRVEAADSRAWDLAARLSFVCGTDTPNTERAARAALVRRLATAEEERAALREQLQAAEDTSDFTPSLSDRKRSVEVHREIHAAIVTLKAETGGEDNFDYADRQIHNALILGAEVADLLPRLVRKMASREEHIQQLISERDEALNERNAARRVAGDRYQHGWDDAKLAHGVEITALRDPIPQGHETKKTTL